MAEIKKDVVVIGSGPAGNTAAIYLTRDNLDVAIISGMSVGGQLTTTTEVENFPGFPSAIMGSDLMQKMMEQAQNLGVEIIYDYVVSVDFSKKPFKCALENGDIYLSNNVIIATGAQAKWLGIPSEEEFKGRGVSACAICDGSFYKNKIVAIVGGGHSAGVETLHLSHLVKKVYLIHRKEDFKMSISMLEKIKNTENVEIITNTSVVEIMGTSQPKLVNKVKLLNSKENKEFELDINGLFVAIGKAPATKIFENTGLEIDQNGYLVTKVDSSKTNISGVYAVGDVTNKPFKQAIVAAGYGAIAALEIEEEL